MAFIANAATEIAANAIVPIRVAGFAGTFVLLSIINSVLLLNP